MGVATVVTSSARNVWNFTASAPALAAASISFNAKSSRPLWFTPISATTYGLRPGPIATLLMMIGLSIEFARFQVLSYRFHASHRFRLSRPYGAASIRRLLFSRHWAGGSGQ